MRINHDDHPPSKKIWAGRVWSHICQKFPKIYDGL